MSVQINKQLYKDWFIPGLAEVFVKIYLSKKKNVKFSQPFC